MTQAERKEPARSNRATADGLYQNMQQTRELMRSLKGETVEGPAEKEAIREVRKSLKEYATLQKDVAERMMDSTERIKQGEVNPKTAYGQTITRFDMDKMTRGMGNVYEAAGDYLDACGIEKNKEAAGEEISLTTGEKVAAFAKEGMTVSNEEAKTVAENEKGALELCGVMRKAPGLGQEKEMAPSEPSKEVRGLSL